MPVDGIRKAQPADLEPLARLRHAFWQTQQSAGLRDQRDLSEAGIRAETEKLLNRPRTLFLVTEEDGDVFAYILATIVVAPHLNPPVVKTLEELYIRPDTRRRGLAVELGERALAEVADIKGAREQMRVIVGNEHGRVFGERMGFEPIVTIMERPPRGA